MAPFLLSRVLLRFGADEEEVHSDLSALVMAPDGSLWTASDELHTLERLIPLEPLVYGNHQSFHLADFVDLFNLKEEVDVEGMDFSGNYLWVTGSQSTKRKKPKGKKSGKALDRLSLVEPEYNRYSMARIPMYEGQLFKTCTHPDDPSTHLYAGMLQTTDESNVLIECLSQDEHLGPFLKLTIPNKENGSDVEGLVAHGQRVFLGLRGPVLRGWAIIVEIEVEEQTPGILTLKEIGDGGKPYRKHFVDLNGLGIRDMCLHGQDMLLLAGPTMSLEGAMQVFRLHDVLELTEDSMTGLDGKRLEVLFNLPFTIGSDHAEGMALYSCLGQPEALMIVYDTPDEARIPARNEVFADVFRLMR